MKRCFLKTIILALLFNAICLAGAFPKGSSDTEPGDSSKTTDPPLDSAVDTTIGNDTAFQELEVGDEAWEDDNWDSDEWAEDYLAGVAEKDIYNLDRFIALALDQNTRMKAANWDIVYYGAKSDEAWWAWFPKIKMTSSLIPAPNWDPPPSSDPDFLQYEPKGGRWDFDSVVWSNEISLIQPLYTFGKISTVREMGPLGIQAAKYRKIQTRDKLVYEVRRAYYTLQLLERMLEILDEGMRYVDDAEDRLEELLAENSESVTEIDRYKFDVFRADLLSQKEETKENKHIVVYAIRILLNLPDDAPIYLRRRFPKEQEPFKTVPESRKVVALMKRNRPEFGLLDVSLRYDRLKAKRQWAYYFPNLFVGLRYKYVLSPKMRDVKNPYLHDPYHANYIVGYLGLSYNFDLPLQIHRARQKNANISKTEQGNLDLKNRMALETEQAFRRHLEKLEKMKINKNGAVSGKKWMISTKMNYDIGIAETSQMVEAIGAYFKTQVYYHKAVHAALLSHAELQFVTGVEPETLEKEALPDSPKPADEADKEKEE